MISKNSFQTLLLVIASSTLLIACGGGGGSESLSSTTSISYQGNTAPARVNEDSAEDIGVAAGETVGGANESSGFPIGVEFNPGTAIESKVPQIRNSVQLIALASGVTYDLSDDYCSSGSVQASIDNITGYGPTTVAMRFSNCVLLGGYGSTYNGRAVVYFEDFDDDYSSYTVTLNNFKISGGVYGQTINLNYSASCDGYDNCIYSSDYEASDGYVHRLSESDISGSMTYGLNGSATFYHSVHGSVSITVSNLSYGNCGSAPDGGSIAFTSTNGTSGTINFFSNCSVSGSWTNGTTSGSF